MMAFFQVESDFLLILSNHDFKNFCFESEVMASNRRATSNLGENDDLRFSDCRNDRNVVSSRKNNYYYKPYSIISQKDI